MNSVPPARGRYRNGLRTRAQILDAAGKVFGQFGYAGGSLRQIAASIDISPASLLQHFGSKEGLLMAVLEQWDSDSRSVDMDKRGLTYFVGLKDLMRYHVSHGGLLELFLTLTAESTHPEHPAHDFIRARQDRTLTEFTAHLREARSCGDIRELTDREIDFEARLLVALLDGLELQWLHDPSIDLVALFDHCLEQTIRRWGGEVPALPAP